MQAFEKLLGEYKLVLGLEIHLHLKTHRKMFCRCNADIYGKAPNTHTCPTCLGLPGALPVPNQEAIKKAQLLGLALNCTLNENSRFDRKHYFYPDLPKGYQISQYTQPLSVTGYVELPSGEQIEIERVHLEEDTGKSFHKKGETLIDFNKSSMPLVEIVTTPTFRSIEDAVQFSKIIQDTVRLLKIGDVDMEKGQMRLEANISLRSSEMERNDELPDYKVEIKNINSFRFMERAVKAEIVRQRAILEGGGVPVQENRGFVEEKNETVAQRGKELAHDYRYFPEPDIPPMHFSLEYLESLSDLLPELPHTVRERLVKQYDLSEKNALFLTTGSGLDLLSIFEEIVAHNQDPETTANLLINKLEYRDLSIDDFIAKVKSARDILTDEEKIAEVTNKILSANPDAVGDYQAGKESSMEFLLGQVMKETKGKADPTLTRAIIRKLLISR